MTAEKDKTLASALGLAARRWAVLASRLFPAPRLVQAGISAPKLLPLTSTVAAMTLTDRWIVGWEDAS